LPPHASVEVLTEAQRAEKDQVLGELLANSLVLHLAPLRESETGSTWIVLAFSSWPKSLKAGETARRQIPGSWRTNTKARRPRPLRRTSRHRDIGGIAGCTAIVSGAN
jgi:hypothetical protein